MTEIAHGSIGIDLNDGEALAGLRRIDAAVERTMSSIERQKATAQVDANIAPFEDRLNRAKRELRRLQGEKASVAIDGDVTALDKAIVNVKRKIKQLDAEKATVEIEYKTNDAAAAAAHKRRMAELDEQSQRQKIFQRQLTDDHATAIRMDRDRTAAIRQQTIGVREQAVQVNKLQQQYAKLTDKLEYLSRKRPLGRENRAKVELSTASTIAEMELLKAKLNALGAHPPVHIKADLDRSASARIGETLRGIVDKASNLSDLTLRLGPFTTSIRGAITALGFLGPTIVDLVGSATSLVGVLGTGLAGATSVAGAAALGAAMNFGGVYAAIKPLATQFKTLTQVQAAYDKAVLKYGQNSRQAKAAQEQLNKAMAAVDPNVRAAAKGISRISSEWHRLTDSTAKRTFGDVIAETVHTAGSLLPTLARNTNNTLGIIDTATTRLMQRLRSPGAVHAFSEIGKNFNDGLGPALLGAEHLGATIGHIAESASRLIEPAAKGFEKWAAGLDRATSDGEKLDGTIDRLGQHAKDVGRFFMALGRLIITVLNGGADAGDRLTNNMTNALDRWNQFLKTPQGQKSMADFFDRASKGADALYHAIAPLATAFTGWATNLSPFVTGVLRGIGYVSQLVAGITKLTGSAGALGTLGATFGAVFAVSRIGAFVSYLSRAADLLREMGAAKGVKTILSGGLGKAISSENFATGGAAAGVEIRNAMVAGGTAAAAEIRAAMVTGGAAGGAENAAGNLLGGARGGAARAVETEVAEVGAGAAAGAKSAGILRTAFAALRGASLLTKASLAGLAVWGGYELAKRFMSGKSAAEQLRDSFDRNGQAAGKAGDAYRTAATGISDTAEMFQRSNIQVREAKKALDSTKKGTDDHRLALLDYRSALRDNQKARQDWITQSGTMTKATTLERNADDARLKQFDQGHAKRVQALRDLIATSTNTRAVKNAEENLAALMRKRAPLEQAAARAANDQAAAALNVGRAWRGQLPVLGQAAQQLGALSRTRPNLAQNIAVKFNSPQGAGAVAREAKAALRAGGDIKLVTRIIADSSDADDAIRKLKATHLDPKTLGILEKGGSTALSVLRQITGHRLTPKQQRIAQAGGPGVIALLGRILGIRFPAKTVHVAAQAAAAISNLDAVAARIASLPTTKTITVTTVTRAAKSVRDSRAVGRGPIGTRRSLVGEGQSGRGAREIIADHKTGMMKVVEKPTIMDIKSTESVIPTEHAYSSRGGKLLADFAKDMGIPGFRRGRKPARPTTTNRPSRNNRLNLTAYGQAQARKTAFRAISKHHWKSTLVQGPMNDVEAAKTAESDKQFQIDRNVGKLKEPTSFIDKVGEDENGNDLFAINSQRVSDWSRALDDIRQQYDDLISLTQDTESKIGIAQRAVASALRTSGRNESQLLAAMTREKRIIDGRHTSRSERQAAQQRYKTYKDQRDIEVKNRADATDDKQSLLGELHDVRQRRDTDTDYRDQYKSDSAAVAGKASDEEAASVPDAPRPDRVDPLTPLQLAQQGADALGSNDALAAIGQGTASTDQQKIDAQQAIINAAQGQLNDSDPSNDSDAYSAITAAAGTIHDIQTSAADAASQSAASATAQYNSYGGAISDLTSTMGSNFQAAGAVASAFGGGAQPAFGAGAFAAFGSPAGAAGVAGGIYAPITQTFHQMPDPNTWSQGISYELQAAMS